MITSYAKSIAEMAQAGAAVAKEQGILGECGKMCHECAFNWNQEHSLFYFLAADNAAQKLIEGGEFNCHTHDYKCAGHECTGFKLAKLVYEKNEPDAL